MVEHELHILQVGDVLVSPDIFTEYFCCDIDQCHGICCVEGSDGAPLELDEIGAIEASLDTVWPLLSASAQSVIDQQGVAYADRDGELVTSIVAGRDCVFTCYEGRTCLCALEKVFREGKIKFQKPISCALYPIREKKFGGGIVGLNYNKWSICEGARIKGRQLKLPLYKFLREPLIRRFGTDWYKELLEVANELRHQGLI